MSTKARVHAAADAAPLDEKSIPTLKPLLVTRKQAAAILGGITITTIKRLERDGVLRGRRLNPRSPTAQVFYNYQDIISLAQADDEAKN